MLEKPKHEVWVDPDHSGETDDEWHRHHAEHGIPQAAHGATTPGVIALVGIGSFIALSLTLFFVSVFFRQVNRAEHVEKVEVDVGLPTVALKASWEADLQGYGWSDPEKGLVHIPLTQAMQLVAKEYTAPKK